jgi:hypothetical protein
VVDAEALEVVDGGHRYRLPAAPSTSIKMKSLPYIRDAFLVCQCQCQWWRVSARLLYFSKSNDGDTLGPNLRRDADACTCMLGRSLGHRYLTPFILHDLRYVS